MPKYRVIDQLHVSSLGPDTMGKGTVFSASKSAGAELVKAGHVELVGDDSDEGQAEEKAAPAPENKAEPAPANKSIISRKTKGE